MIHYIAINSGPQCPMKHHFTPTRMVNKKKKKKKGEAEEEEENKYQRGYGETGTPVRCW